MSDPKKPRITLGQSARSLGAQISGDEDKVNAAQLDEAIDALQSKLSVLQAAREQQSESAQVSPVTRKLIQRETDQLHHELTVKMDAQHTEVVNLLNGIRFMLNIFGEEQSGHDVEELILSTNLWLDQTIKPIETSRQEKAKAKAQGDRPENEHDSTPDQTAAMSQVQQPVQEQDQQGSLGLDEHQVQHDEMVR